MASRVSWTRLGRGRTAGTHHSHAGPFGNSRAFASRSGNDPKFFRISSLAPGGSDVNQLYASI